MNTILHQLNMLPTSTGMKLKVAHAGNDFKELLFEEFEEAYDVSFFNSFQQLSDVLHQQTVLELPDVLLLEIDTDESCFAFIEEIKRNPHLQGLLILLLTKYDNKEWKVRALDLKVHEYYVYPFSVTSLHERINLMIKLRILRPQQPKESVTAQKDFVYKMPLSKRLFDIFFAALILFFLSPVLILIGLIVYIESSGPIIYRSKRVGTGYKIFDFYKFRSMHANAEKMVMDFEQINLYNHAAGSANKAVFFKVANDPRVTKVGQFLRNTSIDELPQLFNILLGDMSFVGNRPLPLYEAEQLTSNEWSMRFLGPAGLTGLWQITKRGKRDVSEQERKELDNHYAKSCSFWMDLEILIKTFPALIQQEKV